MAGRRTTPSAHGPAAFTKDTLRTIAKSKKRFLSIVAITALGATMLTGLSMACIDLRQAANDLYARQNLFDISVQSTLGLVEDDLTELAAIEGVETVEGGYEQETYTRVDGLRATVAAKALLDSGINEPYLVEGELPDAPGEVAVTQNYLNEAGKSIGDTVELEETPQEDPTGLSDLDTGADEDEDEAAADDTKDEGDPVIAGGTYTIVGTIIDPANITQPEGPVAFRAATSSDYTFFVDKSAVVDPETYTVAYLSVEGTAGLSAYSAEYEALVDEVQNRVEDLAPQRERARTEAIKNDAYAEIDEAEADAAEQIADAEQELADGQKTLNESLAEVFDGQRELDTQRADALAQLDDAQATIDQNRLTLAEGMAELEQGRAELAEGIAAYNAQLPAAERELYDGQAELDAQRETFYGTTLPGLEAQRDEVKNAVETLPGTIAQLDGTVSALADGLSQLADGIENMGAASSGSGNEGDAAEDAIDNTTSSGTGGEGGWNAGTGAGDAQSDLTTVATQLRACATKLNDSWTGVQNASSADEAAAAEAVSAFSQAVNESSQTLDAVAPSINTKLESLLAQLNADIERENSSISRINGELETLGNDIEKLQDKLDTIDAEIAALDPNDPDYENDLATFQAEREESATELAEALENKAALEKPLETANVTLTQLKAQQTALTEQQTGIDNLKGGLYQLAGPDYDKNATALASGRIQAAAGLAEAQAALPLLEEGIATAKTQAETGFAEAQQLIDNGWAALWSAHDELTQAQALIDTNAAALADGQEQLAEGQAELIRQRADALAQLNDAQRQLDDALAQIADGQAELDEGRATLEEERADAAEQIADARDQVAAVEQATWYVQDRSSLGSYSSVDSDASSIEAIARIIPVIFFIVAILVSLTTATRMVDEERVLIGLYKALGHSKARVLSKYLVYSVSAALIGGIIGDIAGFVLIPYILFYIFQAMYLLPLFTLNFNLFYAVLGIAAFVIGIGGSTFLSCRAVLAETPATLMRPKAPRAGSRIFLERITFIWRRMGFLNKVTARNLFRYKKRFFMTVFGIMGCTALLICGFSIKNTVESLAPRQYEQIYRYDLMAATMAEDYDTCLAMLEDAPEVTSIESIGVDNVTVAFDGAKESMQLYVIPTGSSIDDYVSLETLSGEYIDLEDAGVVITNNAATVLGLDAGDTVEITTSALDEAEPTVAAITRNYLGNAVYMTEAAYEELFGPLELNGFFAHLDGTQEEQRAFADTLEDDEEFLSITSVAKMHEQFEESFTLINVVVYVVIALAAGLAFVVLFTLSTVNIGEREREIATIKVLGFRKREVRTYINKETLLLSIIGILVGLPAGWALSESFTYILKMPSIYFDVEVGLWCFALAAAFSIVFAIAVSLITNRMLDRTNMVEALKSPE